MGAVAVRAGTREDMNVEEKDDDEEAEAEADDGVSGFGAGAGVGVGVKDDDEEEEEEDGCGLGADELRPTDVRRVAADQDDREPPAGMEVVEAAAVAAVDSNPIAAV